MKLIDNFRKWREIQNEIKWHKTCIKLLDKISWERRFYCTKEEREVHIKLRSWHNGRLMQLYLRPNWRKCFRCKAKNTKFCTYNKE